MWNGRGVGVLGCTSLDTWPASVAMGATLSGGLQSCVVVCSRVAMSIPKVTEENWTCSEARSARGSPERRCGFQSGQAAGVAVRGDAVGPGCGSSPGGGEEARWGVPVPVGFEWALLEGRCLALIPTQRRDPGAVMRTATAEGVDGDHMDSHGRLDYEPGYSVEAGKGREQRRRMETWQVLDGWPDASTLMGSSIAAMGPRRGRPCEVGGGVVCSGGDGKILLGWRNEVNFCLIGSKEGSNEKVEYKLMYHDWCVNTNWFWKQQTHRTDIERAIVVGDAGCKIDTHKRIMGSGRQRRRQL